MAKKKKTTKSKSVQKGKKTSKSKEPKRDLMWTFLKIFFVIALIAVLLYYFIYVNKSQVPEPQPQEQEEVVTQDIQEELKQNKEIEEFVEEEKTEVEPQKRVEVSYSNLEIPKWKTTTTHQQIKNLGYTSSYNTTYGIPNWVAYELTRSEAASDEVKRTNNFMPDPKVKGRSATNADYKGSGYDKGHMAPAADMEWSETVMEQSFYFTNICPQAPGLNRGAWKNLEEDIRQWAIRDSAIVIICGPLFTQKPIKYIPDTQVAIPDAYFKVVCTPYTPQPRGIAFIFPNSKASKHPREYVVTIDSVEKLTGMDFLSQLPDQIENQIEQTSNYALWE